MSESGLCSILMLIFAIYVNICTRKTTCVSSVKQIILYSHCECVSPQGESFITIISNVNNIFHLYSADKFHTAR